MTSSLFDNLSYLDYGVALALIGSQLLILYVLSGVDTPPKGLGLFALYFLLALLAASALALNALTSLQLPPRLPLIG
ncbi:MAG: hypothetical protein NWR64_05180, partial [Haliea sp.]|nr:hypothetical protein [Haliea sp.]